mmetsp:Transcript_23568/g.60233  ORF Transcript_23568/g.60233 Transcript_23568/m.60233 type:complete len:123 (+) Transcript_23568:367-735(+)
MISLGVNNNTDMVSVSAGAVIACATALHSRKPSRSPLHFALNARVPHSHSLPCMPQLMANTAAGAAHPDGTSPAHHSATTDPHALAHPSLAGHCAAAIAVSGPRPAALTRTNRWHQPGRQDT